jgi:hypothetical protein
MKRLFTAVLLVSTAIPINAAEIDVQPLPNSPYGDTLIYMRGEIKRLDYEAFKKKADALSDKVVVGLVPLTHKPESVRRI